MERAELRQLVVATGCGTFAGEALLVADPAAGTAVRKRIEELASREASRATGESGGWLGIATGGTSGTLKFARHDERTLSAAVDGMRRHFSLDRINVVDVLPPHHVSGLMARVRAAATGGAHLAWSWKRLEAGDLPVLANEADGWVLSLVPTQLQRLLSVPAAIEWLRQLRVLFIGGGPVWPGLTDAAAEARLPLALSYGMTETAAMVAALRPEEFGAGARSCGSALPHASITVDADGVVTVGGESLFRGYWPEWREAREWTTEDRGEFDARGHLHVLGRRDGVIITGGKKVEPADVEAGLRASGEFSDVAVLGWPDAEWGEVVLACYPGGEGRTPDAARAAATLSPYQRPKRLLPIAPWPRNAQGKLNRADLRAAVAAWLAGGQ